MKYKLKLKETTLNSAFNTYSLSYRKRVLSFLNKAIGLKFFLDKYDKAFKLDLENFLLYHEKVSEAKVKLILYSVDWSNIYLMNILSDFTWTKFIFNIIKTSPGVYFKCNAIGETHYSSELVGYGNTPTNKVVNFVKLLEKLDSNNYMSLPKDYYDREFTKMRLALTYISVMNANISIVLRFFKLDELSYIIVKKEYLKEFISLFNNYIEDYNLKKFIPKDKDIAIVKSIISKRM